MLKESVSHVEAPRSGMLATPGPEWMWGGANVAGVQESWAAVQEGLPGFSYGLQEKLLLAVVNI